MGITTVNSFNYPSLDGVGLDDREPVFCHLDENRAELPRSAIDTGDGARSLFTPNFSRIPSGWFDRSLKINTLCIYL
jgi:hypothetical protein